MSEYKICVYAICKNEERFVDRWMDSVGEADVVVVTDTGSTDGTVERLRSRGAIVHTESIVPWRFDTARNVALGHVPEDMDICVSNDLDEIFESGWRKKLEDAWQPFHTRARYLFTWTFNSDGTPKKQFPMEKAHRRSGYQWIHPVHEILQFTGEGEERSVWIPGMVLNHYPDISKPRSQYLPLLELSAEENPTDDRTIFWLGREYMYYKMYEKCIETLKKHLQLPSAHWDEERCASMRFIARSYAALNDRTRAKEWLYRAIAECPRVREPYYQMARMGYEEGDWPLVYLMVEMALKITQTTGSYLVEPEAWGYDPYDLGAISCYRLGLYQKSYEYGKKACELAPDHERLKGNLQLIEKMIQI